VESIGEYAFAFNKKMKNVEIPGSLKTIGDYAFYESEQLETVSFADNSVKTIGKGSFALSGVKEVVLGKSLETIGDYAFAYCYQLSSISHIPNTVSEIGDHAFFGCDGLKQIEVEKDSKYFESDENGVLYNNGKTKLVQYPISNTARSYAIPNTVSEICSGAFYHSIFLEDVTIPNSVKTIGAGAFERCTQLKAITIPESVTSIGSTAFSWCFRLTSVAYLGEQDPGAGSEHVFEDCSSLSALCVPSAYKSTEFCGKQGLSPLSECGITTH